MKKLIAGIVIGALVSVPVSVAASRFNETPWTNNIYRVSGTDNNTGYTVSVFDDMDNKCYVGRGYHGNSSANVLAISCVKK